MAKRLSADATKESSTEENIAAEFVPSTLNGCEEGKGEEAGCCENEDVKHKRKTALEMRMSIWMCVVTKFYSIRNERIRKATKVRGISVKYRLQWHGNISRREEEHVDKIVMATEVPGKRRRGRPKRRCLGQHQERLVPSVIYCFISIFVMPSVSLCCASWPFLSTIV